MNFKQPFLILLLLCFVCFSVCGQQQSSPYQLNWEKEAIILGTGAALMGVGFATRNNVVPYTYAELLKLDLDRNNVLSIDRGATYTYSASARNVSDVLLFSSFALPLTTLASKRMRKDYFKITTLLVETMMIVDGLTMMSKHLVKRPRPFVFNPNVDIAHKLEGNARKSFFSGHVSSTAALSFFTAKVFSDYYPDSKLKPYVWTAAALIPATTAYLRYKGGKHYLSDVAVGYGVGALVGFLIPHLHKTKDVKLRPFQIHAGGNSVGFTYVF